MTQKNKNPFVSVIVTTYNRKILLKETIDSILNQTYKNFELIVVDKYSNYDFFSLINSFNDNRIIAFQNQDEGIIAVNRNIGIKKARGEYIAFCDDDDYWHPKKIQIQLTEFKNKDIVGVGTDIIEFFDKTKYQKRIRKKKDVLLDFDKLTTIRSVPFSSLMVRNFGYLFNENPSYVTIEDFDYQLKLTYLTKKYIKFIAVPLVYYRIHEGSNSLKMINTNNVFKAIRKYDEDLFDKLKQKIYFKRFSNASYRCFKSKNYRDSKKYSILAIKNIQFKKIKKTIMMCLIIILSDIKRIRIKRNYSEH